MAKRKEHPKLAELKKQGKTAYSISRINAFNQCEYGYYRTYILGDRGENNCYGIAGTRIHDNLEDIHNGKITEEGMKNDFENMLIEFELNNIQFPTAKIGENWKKDISHFMNNFKKIDRKMLTEVFVLYEIVPDMWIQGYIDAIIPDKNGEDIILLDWKTSSEFKGRRLIEAGRQLLVYKDAIEQLTNKKVSGVCWYMLKYMNVTWNGKTKMLRRRDWVKNIKHELEKDLASLGEDDFVIELLIDKAIADNSLKELPQQIQDKYKIEPAVLWYKPTEKRMKECEDYIINTIKAIESKGNKEENFTKICKDNFFCSNLCNHRNVCKYRK